MRYRKQLTEVMSNLLLGNGVPIPNGLQSEDQSHFVSLVHKELAALTLENAVRYGLSPLEFLAWQETSEWAQTTTRQLL